MVLYRKILVVEDDAVMGNMCGKLLQRTGYVSKVVTSGMDALYELERDGTYGIVLVDLKMPGMDGTELLRRLTAEHREAEVIIMTGYGTVQSAVETMKLGAADYITKPFEKEELLTVVERIVSVHELKDKVARLSAELRAEYHFEHIVGGSRQMQEVFEKMISACRSDSTVLIYGESGTGKELVARAIHYNSNRAEEPFIPVNCAAVPRDLIESELFGYKRGSFTGAVTDSMGLFRAAEGGTVFLDEITEMSPTTQAKLMRVLQEKTIRPLGGTEEVSVEARVIAATNRDIAAALEDGTLRTDFYYRLSVISIGVPPLREREGDIPVLVDHFVRRFNEQGKRQVEGVDKDALAYLEAYTWPGNVRELQNVIESAFALGKSSRIVKEDLPEKIREVKRRTAWMETVGSDTLPTLQEAERLLIERALAETRGNKLQAARRLGISRKRLYHKIALYGMDA